MADLSSDLAGEEFDLQRDELFEMANLEPDETGLDGWVRVSTREGQHGPRVKFYLGRPAPSQPSMSITIESEPRIVASGLAPHLERRHEAGVRQWVQLNRDPLRRFWDDGTSWSRREVNAMLEDLKPLPR